jgi:hypothetical protein
MPSADEVKEHIKAEAKATGKELTDAELDGVAGGFDNANNMSSAFNTSMFAVMGNMSDVKNSEAAAQQGRDQAVFNEGMDNAAAAERLRGNAAAEELLRFKP